MTTIATDGVTIAADGLSSIGGEVNGLSEQKIVIEGGLIYALSGTIALRAALIAWHQGGAKPADVPGMQDADWTLLVIGRNGLAYFTAKCAYPCKANAPFAIGSGADYASALMHAGFSPKNAIRLIIDKRLDVYTGGDIQVIDIKQALGLNEPGLRAVKG